MKVISPLLKHVVYPGLSRSGYLRRNANSGVAVVTYHGILPQGYAPRDPVLDGNLITRDAFVRQVRLLKSNYNVISPEQFLCWCENGEKLPPKAVLLTCDDGLLNTLTDMLPLARELGVKLLFFVTAASSRERAGMLWYERLYLHLCETARGRSGPGISRRNLAIRVPWESQPVVVSERGKFLLQWHELIVKLSAFEERRRNEILEDMRTQIGISDEWESEYSQNEPLRRRFFMLNAHELRDLSDAGMTIGAHTLSHPMLSQMAPELAFAEISQSRAQLQEGLHRPVWALAYPFGNPEAVSAREPELARQAGFSCAFSNVETVSDDDKFLFPRIHVSAAMNLAEFEAHVSGFHRNARERYLAVTAGASA